MLSEVLYGEVLLMLHEFIGFGSWWVHSDTWRRRAEELMELKRRREYASLTCHEFGEQLVERFGAVHLPRSFDFISNALNIGQKRQGWLKSMKCDMENDDPIRIEGHKQVRIKDFTDTLEGLWTETKQIQHDTGAK